MKIFIITLTITALAGGIWFFFFRKSNEIKNTPTNIPDAHAFLSGQAPGVRVNHTLNKAVNII